MGNGFFDLGGGLWDNTDMVGEREFLGFAADVFGVSPDILSLETTMGSPPEWDSIAQLRLVTEIQAKWGVEIPFADVPNVTSLWEFYRRVNRLSPKKAVAVDLDNTLWEGVAAEDGLDAIRPNAALQSELHSLKARGVLLVALSKNDFEDVRAPVEEFGDFVAWRVDWNRKSANLLDVARELNIGVDSFVFVDDNPAERIEMKAALPEVAVAGWPPRLEAYFPAREPTAEDLVKTEEYRAEAERRAWAAEAGAMSDAELWEALGAWLDVRELAAEDVPRVAQLSQKANQFTVRTNRYTEDEVRAWTAGAPRTGRVFTVRTGDRFGDRGLVAFVRFSVPGVDGRVELLDWTMSCRAAGRGLEERAWEEIDRRLGRCAVTAGWVRSPKNGQVRDLFERLGFEVVSCSETEKRYERVSR